MGYGGFEQLNVHKAFDPVLGLDSVVLTFTGTGSRRACLCCIQKFGESAELLWARGKKIIIHCAVMKTKCCCDS